MFEGQPIEISEDNVLYYNRKQESLIPVFVHILIWWSIVHDQNYSFTTKKAKDLGHTFSVKGETKIVEAFMASRWIGYDQLYD